MRGCVEGAGAVSGEELFRGAAWRGWGGKHIQKESPKAPRVIFCELHVPLDGDMKTGYSPWGLSTLRMWSIMRCATSQYFCWPVWCARYLNSSWIVPN